MCVPMHSKSCTLCPLAVHSYVWILLFDTFFYRRCFLFGHPPWSFLSFFLLHFFITPFCNVFILFLVVFLLFFFCCHWFCFLLSRLLMSFGDISRPFCLALLAAINTFAWPPPLHHPLHNTTHPYPLTHRRPCLRQTLWNNKNKNEVVLCLQSLRSEVFGLSPFSTRTLPEIRAFCLPSCFLLPHFAASILGHFPSPSPFCRKCKPPPLQLCPAVLVVVWFWTSFSWFSLSDASCWWLIKKHLPFADCLQFEYLGFEGFLRWFREGKSYIPVSKDQKLNFKFIYL